MRFGISFLKRIGLFCVLLIGLGNAVFGQGSARVLISGVPSVLPSPYLADLTRNYQSGQYPIRFLFTSPTRQPSTFVWSLSLEMDGTEVAHATSQPVTYTPGVYAYNQLTNTPPVLFPTLSELIPQLPEGLQTKIQQTGALPEGDYTLMLEATPTDPEALIITAPAIAHFRVSFPEAPVLLSPADEARVLQEAPVFTWLPVITPAGMKVQYTFLMVEVGTGQSPEEALRGNRAHAEVKNLTNTRFVYTADQLPLEVGKTYAWMVRAETDTGALLQQDGWSEIFTFGYQTESVLDNGLPAKMTRIVLEPAFAYLTDLGQLSVTDDGFAWVLNGAAMLNITSNGLQNVPVQVEDLRIQKGDVLNPTVLGGNLAGNDVPDDFIPETQTRNLMRPSRISWAFGEGVGVSGPLLVLGKPHESDGRLRLRRSGISGSLASEDRFRITDEQASFQFSRMTATYPEASLRGSGVIRFFENTTSCAFEDAAMLGGAQVRCSPAESVKWANAGAELHFKTTYGTFSVESGELAYRFGLDAAVQLGESGACSLPVRLEVENAQRMRTQLGTPACTQAKVDARFFGFDLTQAALQDLTWTGNVWTFEAALGGRLHVDVLGQVTLPVLSGLRLSENGLEVPRFSWGAAVLGVVQPNVQGANAILTGLSGDGFTHTFQSAATATFNSQWQIRLPEQYAWATCLQDQPLHLRDVVISANGVQHEAQSTDLVGCRVPWGTSVFRVQSAFPTLQYHDSNLQAQFKTTGKLVLGTPFRCETGARIEVDSPLLVSVDGLFSGTANALETTCLLPLSMGVASLENVSLVTEAIGGQQTASLAGNLKLAQGQNQFIGSFRVNLMTGQLEGLEIRQSGIGMVKLGGFTFEVQGGTLTENGWEIRGEQTWNGQPVEFRNVVIDPQTGALISGRILISGTVAMAADQLRNDLVLAPNVALSNSGNALVFSFTNPVLTANGLQVSGTGNGVLRYGTQSWSVSELALTYENLLLAAASDHWQVQRGRVTLASSGTNLGWFDVDGFHPNPNSGLVQSAIEALPDKLGLPNVETAYIRLRDADGKLLLRVTEQADGQVRLGGPQSEEHVYTERVRLRAETAELVLAALPNQPSVPVALDLTLDTRTQTIVAATSLQAQSAELQRLSATYFQNAATYTQIGLLHLKTSNGQAVVEAQVMFDAAERMRRAGISTQDQAFQLQQTSLQLLATLHEDGWQVEEQPNLSVETRAGDVVPLAGTLNVTTQGVTGVYAADVTYTTGQTPLEMDVKQIEVDLGEGEFTERGTLEALGEATSCETESINGTANVACNWDQHHDLVEAEAAPDLTLGETTGTIRNENGTLIPDLTIAGMLGVEGGDGTCGVRFNWRWKGTDMRPENAAADCNNGRLDWGWLDVQWPQIQLDRLKYENGRWKFSLKAVLALMSDWFDAEDAPQIPNVTLDQSGISLPETRIGEGETRGLGTFSLGQFSARIKALKLGETVLDWAETASWNTWRNLYLDLEVQTPNVAPTPACLGNLSLPLNGLNISGAGIRYDDEVNLIENCTLSLGAHAGLVIEKVAVGLDTDRGLTALDAVLNDVHWAINGRVSLGEPFTCGETTSIGQTNLRLGSDGLITGTVSGLVPACSAGIGAFKVRTGESTLTFGASGGTQTIDFNAASVLEWNANTSFSGTLAADLMQGKLTDYLFRLDQPVTYNVGPLKFRIGEAQLDADGLLVDGRQSLRLNGSNTAAQFKNARFDLTSGALTDGSIVISGGLALEAGIAADQSVTFTVADPNESFTTDPGAKLLMSGKVTLAPAGLTTNGSASAHLNYNGRQPCDALSVTYADDFGMSLSPFGIQSGRATLFCNTEEVGYLDANGFHPDPNFFIDDVLPERILLPSETVAYLQLKENGSFAVEAALTTENYLSLTTKEGQSVNLVVPALDPDSATPPTAALTFRNVVVNPATGQVISGAFSIDVTGEDDFQLPDAVPFKLTRFDLGDIGASGWGLQAAGYLKLFGTEFTACPITLNLDESGHLKGTVNCTGMTMRLPLLAGCDVASFQISGFSGSVDIPLGGAAPVMALGITAALGLANSAGEDAGETALAPTFDGRTLVTATLGATTQAGKAEIQAGAFHLGFTDLRDVGVGFENNAFTFNAEADARLKLDLPNGQTATFTVKDLSLSQNGLQIPAQSVSVTDLGTWNLGALSATPLAIDLPAFSLPSLCNWDGISAFSPAFDLKLGFSAAGLAAQATLSDVAFRNGQLEGELEKLTLQTPETVHLGATDFDLEWISGRLFPNGDAQGVDFTLGGGLNMPDLFGNTQGCDTDVEARLTTSGGIAATITDFATCLRVDRDPLSVRITTSELNLAFGGGAPTIATFSGAARAVLDLDPADLRATGNIAINLVQNEVTAASFTIGSPFVWQVPSFDPTFTFTFPSATIDLEHLTLNGAASAAFGGASVGVTANQAVFDFDGNLTSGSITFDAELALDIGLGGGEWAFNTSGAGLPSGNVLRLNLPSGVTLNTGGITLNGSASGQLVWGDVTYPESQISLQFEAFTLGLNPLRVLSGRVNIILDQGSPIQIGHYDVEGFHLDNLLAALPIPDRLGLPTIDVAYLQLGDGLGNLNISTEGLGDGRTRIFTTSAVNLVLPSLNGAPTLSATFDLTLNADLSIGTVTAFSVSLSGFSNSAVFGSSPIRLTSLDLSGLGSNLHLLADLDVDLPAGISLDPLQIRDLALSADGFASASISGNINLQTGGLGTLSGQLISLGGLLSGDLRITTEADLPVFRVGASPTTLDLSELNIHFPDISVSGSGYLTLFDQHQTCYIEDFSISDSGASTSLRCDVDETLQLVSGSSKVAISMGRITGDLAYNTDFTYDLRINGALELAFEGMTCGSDVTMRIQTGGDVTVTDLSPNCSGIPEINLGFVTIGVNNLRVPELRFATGAWDFAIQFNADLQFPSLDGITLPELRKVTISPEGITFPAVDWDAAELGSLPHVTLPPLDAQLTGFRIPTAFSFPWFSFDGVGAGDWSGMNFDLRLSPQAGLGDLPACMEAAAFTVQDLHVGGDTVSFDLPATLIEEPGCEIPLGEPASLWVTRLDGSVSATFGAEGFTFDPTVHLGGHLTMNEPFTCNGDETMQLATTELTLLPSGRVEGTVRDLVPACPVSLGAFNFQVTSSALTFGELNGVQIGTLDGSANLEVSVGQFAIGSFSLDLPTGALKSYSFSLENPFDWSLPSTSPVFTFSLPSATIRGGIDLPETEWGLHTDGRGALKFPDGTSLGVTFDDFRFSLELGRITGGSLTFDAAFGFDVSIGDGDALSWQAVPLNNPFNLAQGFHLSLPEGLSFNADGLQINGAGLGQLKYGDYNLPDLDLDFDGVTFGLYPFAVMAGNLNFKLNGTRVAWLDLDGFHLDPAIATVLLPDQLPLPSLDVAFLQLKVDGNFVVNWETTDLGRLRLDSIAPVSLHIPALNLANPSLPVFSVSFNDVEIDPLSFEWLSGEISIDLSAGDQSKISLPSGFPLNLTNITIGRFDGISGLYLTGNLKLFGADMMCETTGYVQSDGQLHAQVTCPGLDEAIPLVPSTYWAMLNLNSITGSLDYDLLGSGGADYALSMLGKLRLNSENRVDAEAAFEHNLTMEINRTAFSALGTSSGDATGLPEMNLAVAGLKVNDIPSFTLDYDFDVEDWAFSITVDADLWFGLAEGQTLRLPSMDVVISDTGIQFPTIDLHESSTPPLALDPFNLGAVSADLIGFRLPAVHLPYSGSVRGFEPRFDLDVAFPTLSGTDFEDIHVTGLDLGLSDGIFTGDITAYVPDGLLNLDFGGSVAFRLDEITGSFRKVGGEQRMDFSFAGGLSIPKLDGSGDSCPETDVTLELLQTGKLRTQITDFAACVRYDRDPITFSFTRSDLTLVFGGEGLNTALLEGTGVATIERETGTPVTGTGNLTMDLLTPEITDASIDIIGPFEWGIPTANPLMLFTVNSAHLDQTGLSFNGSGSVEANGATIGVTFNDPYFRYTDWALTRGNITFTSGLAFDIGLSGSPTFTLVSATDPVTADNVLHLGFPATAILNKNGLALTGEGSATLRYGGTTYADLRLDFNRLTWSLSPSIALTSGSVDIYYTSGGTESRIAWLDVEGFHLDNILAALPVPAKIALPSEDVAYLVLRENGAVDGALQVATENLGDGTMRIYTTGATYIVFTKWNARTDVTFDLVVNSADFSIQRVNSFTASPDEATNELIFGSFPVTLRQIGLSGSSSTIAVQVDANIALPASLTTEPLVIEDLTITENGFEAATFSIGRYGLSCNASNAAASYSFTGEVTIRMCGVEVEVGSGGSVTSVAASGEITAASMEDAAGNSTEIAFEGAFSGTAWAFSGTVESAYTLGALTLSSPSLSMTGNDSEFSVALGGVLTMEKQLSSDFSLEVEELRIGTSGIHLTVNAAGQSFCLFENTVCFELTEVAMPETSPLTINMDGRVTFFPEESFTRTVNFTDFQFDAEGHVSLGSASVNLLGSTPLDVIDDVLTMDEITLGVAHQDFTLTLSGNAKLPGILQDADADFSTTAYIDASDGSVHFTDTDVAFALDATGKVNNGRGVEVDLGGFATIEPTAVLLSLNLQDFDESAFAAAFNLYIQDDNNNTVVFGDPNDLADTPGVAYDFGRDRFDWNVTYTPSPAIDFTTDFFSISLQSLSVEGSTNGKAAEFEVTISGSAALMVDGIDGSGAISNFRFSESGVEDWGTFGGGSFTMMDLFSLEVGAFQSGSGELSYTCSKSSSPSGTLNAANTDTKKCTINTESYLIFGGANLTLTDSFAGGVDSVMVYKETDGDLYLNITGFNISLGEDSDLGYLKASLEYRRESSGFLLRAAGGGSLSGVGFAFVGKFANLNEQLSFGLFAYISVPIPLYPGIAYLTGAGAGFFYQPDNEDVQLVTDMIDFELNHPLPDVSNMDFTILLAADLGLIGTPGAYVIEARSLTMFAINDDGDFAVSFDLLGTCFIPDLEVSGYLMTSEIGNQITIMGGIGASFSYAGLLSGDANVDFQLIKNGSDEAAWAINGHLSLDVLKVINANGDLVIWNDGFYFDFNVHGGFDVFIIAIDADFDLAMWWFKEDAQFGAYAAISIEASVLGGLATAGGTAYGALILDSGDYLFYAGASLYVSVIGVFHGDVGVWLSLENGKWDAGEGSNPRYEAMVDDARQEAEDAASGAESASDALDAAANDPSQFELTDAELKAAGENLQQMSQFARGFYGILGASSELTYYDAVGRSWSAHDDLYNTVLNDVLDIDGDDWALVEDVTDAYDAMEEALADVENQAPDVMTRLDEMTMEAVSFAASLDVADFALRNPVSNFRADWDGETPPSVEIDRDANAENVSTLTEYQADIAALDAQYQEALNAAIENLNALDAMLEGGNGMIALGDLFIGQSWINSGAFSSGALSGLTTAKVSGKDEGNIQADVRVGFRGETSVNQMASLYKDALEKVYAYYGKQISYLWQMRTRYQERFAVIDGMQSEIETEIETVDNLLTWSDSSEKNAAIEITKDRMYLLKILAGLDSDDALTEATAYANASATSESNLEAAMDTQGVDLWYTIHHDGLDGLIEDTKDKVDEIIADYQTSLDNVQTSYGTFTTAVDELYTVKAQMVATVISMLDEYLNWRESVYGDSVTTWTTTRTEMSQWLEAPVITGITYTANHPTETFYNAMNFAWSATHPTEVTEYAYSIEYGDEASIASSAPFMSAGTETDVTFYAYADTESDKMDDVKIRVRARGAGGNTAIRYATVSGKVADSDLFIFGLTGSGDVLGTDTTAPIVSNITMDYRKNNNKYWSNETDRITFSVVASDTESDVAEVEYAIGTYVGGTNVTDWTKLEGATTRSEDGLTLTTTATVRSLSLETDGHYFIQARAINGAGLTSSVYKSTVGLYIDTASPNAPTEYDTDTNASDMLYVLSYDTYTPAAYDETVSWSSDKMNNDTETASTPTYTIEWNAPTDTGSGTYKSGIRRYHVILSTNADVESAKTTETEITTTGTEYTWSGDALDFNSDFYAYVWAEDHAGNLSETLTFGPFTPNDPDGPTTPIAMAQWGNDNVFVTQASEDNESGTKGYQYALGTTEGGTDLRAWPTDDSTDLIKGYQTASKATTFNASPPSATMEGLPAAGTYYVSVRAINKDGDVSTKVISGPVVADATAPSLASVTLTYSKSANQYTLTTSSLSDYGSGLHKLEYKLEETTTGTVLQDWTLWKTYSGTTFSSAQTKTVSRNDDTRFTVKLSVRVTNRAGLQTTTTDSYVINLPVYMGDLGGF